MNAMNLKDEIKSKYGEAARRVASGRSSSCCAPSCCGGNAKSASTDVVTSNLYEQAQKSELPASRGCGDPTALAQLNPGEVVLDLGSGGGSDVLLSARRVGAAGKAYGLDMTDEMLALANENKRKTGL